MTRSFGKIGTLTCAAMLWLVPLGATGQECTLRLSEFETATRAFTSDVADLSDELTAMFSKFSALELKAATEPDTCPAGFDQGRTAAASLAWDTLVDRGDTLIECGQFFATRVLSDIEKARNENDSQLAIRLGEIQQRIFDVERHAIEAATQATFLGFRAQGLVTEHDALARRCTVLSDIYD